MPPQYLAQEEIVCDSPYIRYGSECCLDQNQNSVCDDDENGELVVKTTSSLDSSLCGDGELVPLTKKVGMQSEEQFQTVQEFREFYISLSPGPATKIIPMSDEELIEEFDIQIGKDGLYTCSWALDTSNPYFGSDLQDQTNTLDYSACGDGELRPLKDDSGNQFQSIDQYREYATARMDPDEATQLQSMSNEQLIDQANIQFGAGGLYACSYALDVSVEEVAE